MTNQLTQEELNSFANSAGFSVAGSDATEAVHEIFERDGPRAVRRAIVRAAAAIAESKEEVNDA